MGLSPGVVPAVRLDEVHVPVFGQEGHQLVIGPEMEANDSTTLIFFFLLNAETVAELKRFEKRLQHNRNSSLPFHH